MIEGEQPNGNSRHRHSVDIAIIILAVGFAFSLLIVTVAVFYDSVVSPASAGLSDNATLVLTGWGGGVVGILGGYVGYKANGKSSGQAEQ